MATFIIENNFHFKSNGKHVADLTYIDNGNEYCETVSVDFDDKCAYGYTDELSVKLPADIKETLDAKAKAYCDNYVNAFESARWIDGDGYITALISDSDNECDHYIEVSFDYDTKEITDMRAYIKGSTEVTVPCYITKEQAQPSITAYLTEMEESDIDL